jgi:serine/threonine-protein kinase PpkA
LNATVLLKSVDIDIPGYTILRPIGEGGMASVFLAIQKSLEREVALKVMSPVLAANAEFASRFLIEGKITAKLQHPNLVTVYDIGTHNGVYYLAAEYIPGGTLKERVTEGGISVAETLDVVSDIAQGLDFAHQKGFVHRDVKPGNVLYRNDGRVVLADFGIAKAMDGSNSSTVAGASIGTPDYMSPEQARGEPVDGRSDLYSLGTMFYEILVGHPPYQAADPFTVALMHVTHPIPVLPEPYEWLQPLIQGLMAKNPAERYNTGAAFIEAMHKLVESAPQGAVLQQSSARKPGGTGRLSGTGATQQRTRVNLSKASTRPAWLLPSVAVIGLLASGLIAWLLMSGNKTFDANTPATVDGSTSSNQVDVSATQNGTSTGIKEVESIDGLQGSIDDWLKQADYYLELNTSKKEVNRKLVDEEDSAWYFYRKVLEKDPANARALTGVHGIADYYAKGAYDLCALERYPSCGLIARQGLVVVPDHPLLKQLEEVARAGEAGEKFTMPSKPN